MIQMLSLVCPKCNSNLEVDAERKECFCQYCGAKLLIDKGEIINVYRDEAKIMEVDLHERMWKEELAEKERERQEKEKKRKRRIWGYIIWFLISVLILVIPLFLGEFGVKVGGTDVLFLCLVSTSSVILELILLLSNLFNGHK